MDQLRVYNRYLFHNRVKTSGRSLRLGKGGLGLVLFGSSNKDGMKVLSPEDIENLSLEDRLAFQVGQNEQANIPGGLVDNKNVSTFMFRLKDVVGVKATQPDYKVTEDEFRIGYNGINEDTALQIPEGETRSFEIQLDNGLVSFYAGNKDRHLISFDIHREEGQTMQEVVTKAVRDLNREGFNIYDKYNNLVEIGLVDSTSEEGEEAYKLYELNLGNAGEAQVPFGIGTNPNIAGFVQSQYDDFDVKEVEKGKFSVMLPEGEDAPEDFVMPGIMTVQGDCDGCEELEGYEPTSKGYVYSVKIQDQGDDLTGDIEGAIENSEVEKIGPGVYVALVENTFDKTEIEGLENPEILFLGHTDEICVNEGEEEFKWVETDNTCTAKKVAYTIVIPDDECGEDRLEELKEAYGNEDITLETSGGCNSEYKMEVLTNVVCDECDEIYLDIFEAEAPTPFEGIKWKEEEKEWDEEALMGIRVKAKRIKNIPPMYLQDMGNTNTAVDLSVSAGICNPGDVISDTCPEDKDISVIKIATNKGPVNMGYQLRFFEDRDTHFMGNRNPGAKSKERFLTGTESLIEPDKQYVIHSVVVMDEETRDRKNKVTFKLPSKIGYQETVEELLNALAAKLGLEGVKTL